MSESPYVFEVTQHNFAAVVVENSQRVPVLVDFWADWCQPCKTLTPLLTKLAQEYRGAVVLAKINADAEQALTGHFQVRSLPTVMVVWQGQIVDQLVGVQPEAVYREAISRFQVQPVEDPVLEQVEALWQRGRHQQALHLLRETLSQEPDSLELKVALAEKLLQLDRGDEVRTLLESLPAEERDRQPVSGLLVRLRFADLVQGAPELAELVARVRADPDDHPARQQLAARYALAGSHEAALEQFMDLMIRVPQFEDGAGRKGLLAIFEMLGNEHPLVTTYRRRMFSLLH